VGAYRDLQKKTDAEVEELYDQQMGRTVPSLDTYRDELYRRDGARRDEQMIKYTKEIRSLTVELVEYTKAIRSLTVTVVGATIVALAISVVAMMWP
jgi:hypothetical protein